MKPDKSSSSEKNRTVIAVAALVIIIVAAIGGYLLLKNYPDILNNLFGGEKTIEAGDCADVHYIGRFAVNDTVFDTSYTDVENKTGGTLFQVFVNPNMDLIQPSGYENYTSGVISGFLNGLVGMKEGETKTVTIPPEDAYGDWNVTMLEELFELYYGSKYFPRYATYNFTETLLTDYLPYMYAPDADPTNLSVNQTFTYINGTSQSGENVSWQVQIINISGENVTIKHLVQNGTIVNKGFWNSTIIVDNETSFRERADPEINSTFTSGEYPYFQHIKILGFNETAITMAMNIEAPSVEFVDQTLVFEIEVIKIYKTSQEES